MNTLYYEERKEVYNMEVIMRWGNCPICNGRIFLSARKDVTADEKHFMGYMVAQFMNHTRSRHLGYFKDLKDMVWSDNDYAFSGFKKTVREMNRDNKSYVAGILIDALLKKKPLHYEQFIDLLLENRNHI